MKYLFILLFTLPIICHAQGGLSYNPQGNSGQALYQSSYVKSLSGEMMPILSSPPTYKIAQGGDTIQITTYVDSATRKVMILQPDKTYAASLASAPNQTISTNFTIQSNGWNVIYESPNVDPSHEGAMFDEKGFAYHLDVNSIWKRPVNPEWNPVVLHNDNPVAGLPAGTNHLGGGKIHNGRIYAAVERYVACGNSDGTLVAWYDTATLNLISYNSLDSTSEISGLCFLPNGHMISVNFCDTNHMYEYDSSFAFVRKITLSSGIPLAQGLCYRPDNNRLYISSNLGDIYQVQTNGTVDTAIFRVVLPTPNIDAYEDIDWSEGVLKWSFTDNQAFSMVVYLSDTKKQSDFAYMYNTLVPRFGEFTVNGRGERFGTNPSMIVTSQTERATIGLNSVFGYGDEILMQEGGRTWFDLTMRSKDQSRNLTLFRSSTGYGFSTSPAFTVNPSTGYFGINLGDAGVSPQFPLDVNGAARATSFRLAALNTAPATATATGTVGDIRITAGFIYVCTATNTWVRASLVTW